jgi:UDP-glucuronate decarboxylase
VLALTGSSAKIVHRPLPADDPKQRCPDISRAQELLGWQPQVQLRDGLKKTIAYFEGLLSASVVSKH